MSDKNISILSTRPLDEALIEKAAFQQITIDTRSFIEIKKLVTPQVAEEIKALAKTDATVVFTSMNAVEVVIESLPANTVMPDWKIYCIGGATFTLVKKYWSYDQVIYTAKNAAELAERIVADKVPNISFFCSNIRREELPNILQDHNIPVTEIVVYETIETAAKMDKSYDAILFFSPSAVHSFFSKNTVLPNTLLFAIGNTSAKAIKLFSNNRIIISEFPAKDQLVEKAIKYFSTQVELNG
jgi:uroporphyrinogen-III synthase